MTVMPRQSRGRQLSNVDRDDDPLARAIAPPVNESPQAREIRLATEKAARQRSEAIDEEINRQRLADKKTKCVKVLLLGE